MDGPAERRRHQELLDTTIVPGIMARGIPGLHGVDILRRDDPEVELLTIMSFDDWAAVQSFAGPDTTVSLVPSSAGQLLARYEQHA
jgi:hypothetical protein